MKKTVITLALVILATGSYFVFAQDNGGMMSDGKPMCPMCKMMGSGMMQKSMVAVDGGVVVLAGNQLIKYDDQLNKVAEAQVEVDMTQMHQQMQRMMENCPMMQQMRQGGVNGNGSRNSETVPPKTAPSEHQQHHPDQP